MATPALKRIRIATIIFPPAGLVLLWRERGISFGRKLFGTLGTMLYSLIYATLIVLALMQFAGLEIEWRGGFPPVLTFVKTKPDYAAVEAHRARQAVAPAALASSHSTYWSDFRGPNRDGHYAERPIQTNWPSAGLKERWRQPVGGGYASFVVAGGRAFTIEQRRDHEAVTAYDVATGRELWAHTYPAAFSESMGGDGPRATPTFFDGRVYSLGAEGEFCCLDAISGRLLWRTNVLEAANAKCLYFALSTSPLVVGDNVVVLSGEPLDGADGSKRGALLSFDKVTGAPAWSALPERMAYASPMLVTLGGQRQLLITTATRIVGLQPESGALLWEIPWKVQYDNSIAQPLLVSSNRFLVSAGYGTGCMLVEAAQEGSGFQARQVWKNQNLKTKFNSAVFLDGFVYGLDEGILTCLDAASGRRQWKEGRYGYGQMLLASGHLVIISGEGDLILVRANPERHEEVARFPAIKGKTWNHPAIADGGILVRNAVEMACFEIALP